MRKSAFLLAFMLLFCVTFAQNKLPFTSLKPFNKGNVAINLGYERHIPDASFGVPKGCLEIGYGFTDWCVAGLYAEYGTFENRVGLWSGNILKTTFSDTIIRKPEDLSFNEEGLVVWQKISYLPNERFHHYEDVYSGRVFGPISLRTNDFPIGEKGRKDLIYHNCFASLFILAKTCTYMESNNAGHNELYYAFYYHDMIFVDGYVENGLETGKWKFYYVDKLIIEAEFENGQLNGLCNFYDLHGNLIRSTKFINNKNVDELPNIQPSGQWSKRNPRKWEWIELKRFKE